MKRVILILFLAISCGGPRIFVNPQADLPFYNKVGILPFWDLSGTRMAGEKVATILYTELMITGQFEILNPAEMVIKMKEVVGKDKKPVDLSIQDLVKIGKAAGLKGIIQGVVVEYGMTRSGGESYPIITLDVRLIDTQYGKVVWEISYTKSGRPKIPILGIGGISSLPELNQKVCKELAEIIAKKMAK